MTSSSSFNSRHYRQLDTSLERQARLAAANAVASFSSPVHRQRSASLNASFEQTRWILVMPSLEVMYLFSFRYLFSFAYCVYMNIFNSTP
jgi:hypothetical protein